MREDTCALRVSKVRKGFAYPGPPGRRLAPGRAQRPHAGDALAAVHLSSLLLCAVPGTTAKEGDKRRRKGVGILDA